MKTKEEVRDILGLAELPDDEFMELLEAAGEEETVTGVPPRRMDTAQKSYVPSSKRR